MYILEVGPWEKYVYTYFAYKFLVFMEMPVFSENQASISTSLVDLLIP